MGDGSDEVALETVPFLGIAAVSRKARPLKARSQDLRKLGTMFSHCCNHTATFLAILPVFLMAFHGRKPPVSLAHCIHPLGCRCQWKWGVKGRNKPGMNGNWAERGAAACSQNLGVVHAPGRGKQEESVPAEEKQAYARSEIAINTSSSVSLLLWLSVRLCPGRRGVRGRGE